jgi:virulence-associated protein VagC
MNSQTIESVVFRNGNSLAIRLVGECRLPVGTRVREQRDGDRIILEPILTNWPSTFLESLGAWDEDIERPSGTPKDPFE